MWGSSGGGLTYYPHLGRLTFSILFLICGRRRLVGRFRHPLLHGTWAHHFGDHLDRSLASSEPAASARRPSSLQLPPSPAQPPEWPCESWPAPAPARTATGAVAALGPAWANGAAWRQQGQETLSQEFWADKLDENFKKVHAIDLWNAAMLELRGMSLTDYIMLYCSSLFANLKGAFNLP